MVKARKISVPKARRSDPQTSWDAARSVENLRVSHKAVFDCLEHFGPMTDEQLLSRLPFTMSSSGARTRRKELVDKGLVRDSGRRSRTISGRQTIVWEIVPAEED